MPSRQLAPSCSAAERSMTTHPFIVMRFTGAPVLAMRPANIHFDLMRSFLAAAFAFALLVAFCASGTEQALARSKRHSRQPSVPSIAMDDTGTPIIMQGLQPARRAVGKAGGMTKEATKEAKRHVRIPHGSPGFIPPISSQGPLPRTPQLIGQARAAAPPTTRLPSATLAPRSRSSISRFSSTRASATIPPTATPTFATISTTGRRAWHDIVIAGLIPHIVWVQDMEERRAAYAEAL